MKCQVMKLYNCILLSAETFPDKEICFFKYTKTDLTYSDSVTDLLQSAQTMQQTQHDEPITSQ